MRLETSGSSRLVLLTRRYAIKWPRASSWRGLLLGLLANIEEAGFGKLRHVLPQGSYLCPVVFALYGGWLLVQRRCQPLEDGIVTTSELRQLMQTFCIPGEAKLDSWGWFNDRLVVCDYGN